MFRLLAFLTAWFFLAGTAAAHADPVSAIVTAVAGFLASGTALANFVVGLVLSVGTSLLQKALAPKPKPAGVKSEIQVGGDNPLSFILGHYASPGQLEYVNTWGRAGKTKNAYLTMVVSISDLPVGALTGLWVDDKKVTLPAMTGIAPYDQGWPVAEFKTKNDNNHFWIRFYDGTQTEADSFLLSTFGGDPDRPYTSDMIFRGVAYAIVTAQFDTKMFSGIPRLLFETDGIKLYDVREDSSAGGSGLQRWDDPSTWAVSDNPIVHAYNICRGIYYGGEWVWGGQSTEAFQLPAANWMAAMNACDLDIALAAGGTEKQFRAGREIGVDEQPLDVIEEYMAGCSGRFAEVGGIYKVLVGAPGAAVYSFTDDQIVVSKGQSFDPFPGLESTYNGAQASYPEPSEKWGMKDAPAYFRTDLEALDDGRRLVDGLKFPTVPYATQVQRLLKAAVEDARRFRQHQFYLPPEAWLLEPNDVVSWTSTRNGYVEKKFLVTSITGGSNFLQLVNLKEIDPADYDWTAGTDEQPVDFAPIGPIDAPSAVMTGWNAAPIVVTDAAGNNRRPGIQVTFDGDLDDVQFVRVQVRKAGDTALQFDGTVPYGDLGADGTTKSVQISFASILPATAYEVRGILIPYSGNDALWSNESLVAGEIVEGAWLGVTTDDIRFGRLDLYDGIIDLPALADQVKDLQQNFAVNIRALSEQIAQVALGDADGQFGAYRQAQAIYTKVLSQTGGLSAQVEQAILAATGPDSALATAITALNGSSSPGDVGDATFQISTEYTPATGWDSKIGMQVRAAAGGVFTDAGFFIEAKADGTSRILLTADQIVMVNPGQEDQPFAYIDGVLTMQATRVGTITAGRMQNAAGTFVIDLDGGFLEIYSG
jgi:hypothetical protein